MIRINENFLKLRPSYLFSEISRRLAAFQDSHKGASIIRLGIGDVTRPLPRACIDAFHKAVDEMARQDTFRGYGPEQGYLFLREKIAEFDYRSRGADIDADEIFISDGAKSDTANIQEIFSQDVRVAIPDPVYPVYLDTNVMAGRAGDMTDGRYSNIAYLDATPDNGFVPTPPDGQVDLVYLCYPNNPTGAVITKERLAQWVDYARRNKALILYDAAYEAFIRDDDLPRTIYEIEGATEVAIEFRSFSKTAGFTGTRCAFTVVPKECTAYDSALRPHSLHGLWMRRQSTKMNGVSYPVQRAAEAVYTPEGRAQVKELIDGYMENASLIRSSMEDLGLPSTGGENSPYIWVETGMDSWDFFDMLLEKAHVVCTPGEGFGRCGRGFVRISAFNSRQNVELAIDRIRKVLS
ncbi:MAG TPA: LL-diaminopimelate aminotransferase [Deltaproteobacteria bacterium]|mgnify:CR=1 FL=1|nr:LL-diaminopimelate aminotransferase [Deltaproteobacteria bacterium]HPP80313.1 LL-diaminopimelate aminotransferase [Deltaproteobacteria bacterium]